MNFGSFLISFLLHALLLLAIFFWPAPPPLDLTRAEVYQISLVQGAPGGENLPSPILGPRPAATGSPSLPAAAQALPEGGQPQAAQAAPSPELPTPAPEMTAAPQPASQPAPLPTPPAQPIQIPQTPSVAIPAQPPELRHEPEAEAEPQPAPEPEPQPSPEPAPAPVPEPEPEPTPAPVPAPEPEPEPTPEPEPEPEPAPKPDPAPKPEPTPKPESTPPARPARPSNTQGGSAANNALRDLQGNKPSGNAASNALAEFARQGISPGVGGGGGSGSGPGGGGISDIYAAQIILAVQPNWNVGIFGRDNLTVLIRIRIDASGRILQAQIERSSGRNDFDASAINAVERTGTLPVPPNQDLREISINFNSQAMAGR